MKRWWKHGPLMDWLSDSLHLNLKHEWKSWSFRKILGDVCKTLKIIGQHQGRWTKQSGWLYCQFQSNNWIKSQKCVDLDACEIIWCNLCNCLRKSLCSSCSEEDVQVKLLKVKINNFPPLVSGSGSVGDSVPSITLRWIYRVSLNFQSGFSDIGKRSVQERVKSTPRWFA